LLRNPQEGFITILIKGGGEKNGRPTIFLVFPGGRTGNVACPMALISAGKKRGSNRFRAVKRRNFLILMPEKGRNRGKKAPLGTQGGVLFFSYEKRKSPSLKIRGEEEFPKED